MLELKWVAFLLSKVFEKFFTHVFNETLCELHNVVGDIVEKGETVGQETALLGRPQLVNLKQNLT